MGLPCPGQVVESERSDLTVSKSLAVLQYGYIMLDHWQQPRSDSEDLLRGDHVVRHIMNRLVRLTERVVFAI